MLNLDNNRNRGKNPPQKTGHGHVEAVQNVEQYHVSAPTWAWLRLTPDLAQLLHVTIRHGNTRDDLVQPKHPPTAARTGVAGRHPLVTPIAVTHLGDLDTPVEQQLRPDVVLVLVHVVEQAAVGHELGDQLDGGAQAHAQQTHQVGVLHAGHDQGLLGERGVREDKEGLRRLLHFMEGTQKNPSQRCATIVQLIEKNQFGNKNICLCIDVGYKPLQICEHTHICVIIT